MSSELKIQKKSTTLESTGLPLIDLDHNRLIILLKYIIESLKKEKELKTIPKLAKYLEDGLEMHFLHEEEIMKTIQYLGYRHHSNEHLKILNHCRKFFYHINLKSCRQYLLENFLNIYEKLEFHILHEDLKLKSFVEVQATTAERVSNNFYIKFQNKNKMKNLKNICKVICKKK